MLWISLCLVSFFIAIVAFATSIWALRMLSATTAQYSSRISALESQERLTPSKLAALGELNESLARAEELLVKVNRREIARAKKRDDSGVFVASGAMTLKDQLRRRAGLIAGKPAPHNEAGA